RLEPVEDHGLGGGDEGSGALHQAQGRQAIVIAAGGHGVVGDVHGKPTGREVTDRLVHADVGFEADDHDGRRHALRDEPRESVLLGRFAHLGFWEGTGTDDEQRVAEALAHVDLGALSRRDLATLSGGEQRRAAIARLLVQSPSLYLLDEPTNHLDPGQQLAVLERLRTLTRGHAAVLASLHDPNLALRFATHVCLLYGTGPAEVVECASLDASRLGKLYGIPFTEARIGAHRVVTAS
ncbi:MAG: ABC transporter ATP-binding protein, partial [Steroidobacteraceae bacterium]|nr:ABC transporter ATP-binding protein [Steroidobacteraceae bacterium]